jgi:hypothetical protein
MARWQDAMFYGGAVPLQQGHQLRGALRLNNWVPLTRNDQDRFAG